MHVYLKYIYYLLLVLGFFFLIVRRKKLGLIFPLFITLYFFNIVTQAIYDVAPLRAYVNPYLAYHINQVISAIILHLYYYRLLKNNAFRKSTIIGFMLFATYFISHFVISLRNIFTIDFTDFTAEGLLICIYVVFFLVELYKSDTVVTLQRNPHVMISIGNLIFFSGCMFVMGLSSYLRQNSIEIYSKVIYINYFLNLLLYSLYLKAFLCNSKMKKL